MKHSWDVCELFLNTSHFLVCLSIGYLTHFLSDIMSILSRWDIFLKFFGYIPLIFLNSFQIIWNFLYVCQSVTWLTSILIWDKYRNISSSGRDILLNFFGGIPVMFVHLFQVILNFMYVCQSVSWLTSLLKLYKYRDISSSGRYIFRKFSGYIPWMFSH